jgi:hypothetical protein
MGRKVQDTTWHCIRNRHCIRKGTAYLCKNLVYKQRHEAVYILLDAGVMG